MSNFKIVTKPQFTITGYSRKFNAKTSYEEIPKFWEDHYLDKGAAIAKGTGVRGDYGVCCDCDESGQFTYMIADDYTPAKEIPAGAEVKVIPAHVWAVFACNGALPRALQEVNTYVFNEWLPNNKQYRMADDLNIEAYFQSKTSNPDDDYSEIWIPVEEKR